MSKVVELRQQLLARTGSRRDAERAADLIDGLIAAVREDDAAHTDRVADGVAAHEPVTDTHRAAVDALRVMAEHLRGLAVGE